MRTSVHRGSIVGMSLSLHVFHSCLVIPSVRAPELIDLIWIHSREFRAKVSSLGLRRSCYLRVPIILYGIGWGLVGGGGGATLVA